MASVSRFSLYREDGMQRVLRHVGEKLADVNVVNQVAHGGGRVMVWAGECYVLEILDLANTVEIYN